MFLINIASLISILAFNFSLFKDKHVFVCVYLDKRAYGKIAS